MLDGVAAPRRQRRVARAAPVDALVTRVGPDARCWMSRAWLCFRQMPASGGSSTYAGVMRCTAGMPVTSTAGDAGSVEHVVISVRTGCGAGCG